LLLLLVVRIDLDSVEPYLLAVVLDENKDVVLEPTSLIIPLLLLLVIVEKASTFETKTSSSNVIEDNDEIIIVEFVMVGWLVG
jgi:hypothetical protein